MTENQTVSQSTFWVNIGKFLSGLIATAATLYGLYAAITPSEPDIRGTAYYHPFNVPPQFSIGFQKAKNLNSQSFLFEALKTQFSTNVPEAELNKFSEVYASNFKENFEKNFSDGLIGYKSYLWLSIENKGKKPAKEVVIDIPETGIAYAQFSDGTSQFFDNSKRFQIKSISQGSDATFFIWLEKTIDNQNENQIRISHADGVGEVKFLKEYIGRAAWFAENEKLVIVAFVVATLSVVFFIIKFISS